MQVEQIDLIAARRRGNLAGGEGEGCGRRVGERDLMELVARMSGEITHPTAAAAAEIDADVRSAPLCGRRAIARVK